MILFWMTSTLLLVQADGHMLTKGHRSDFRIDGDGAAVSISDSGLWRYSELTRSYQPVLQVEIVNNSARRIRKVRIGVELRGEKATERVEFTSELEISAGASRRYERRFDKQDLDRIGDVDMFTPTILSLEQEESVEVRVVTGLVMLSADCAADYAKLLTLSGVALRAAMNDFIKFGCGEMTLGAEASPVEGRKIPGLHYLRIEGSGGSPFNAWARPQYLGMQTRKQFVKRTVKPVLTVH